MSDDSTPARAKSPVEAMGDVLEALHTSMTPAAENLRRASSEAVQGAARSARTTRVSTQTMAAVRPGRPSGADTGRYTVLAEEAASGVLGSDGALRT